MDHPLGLLHLTGQIVLHLLVVALLQQEGVVPADPQGGEIVVVGQQLEVVGKADHNDIRIDVGEIFPGGKAGARPGIEGADMLAGGPYLLRGGLQLPGNEAVAALGQGVQLALHNTHCQFVHRGAADQLELQALGQIPGAHAGRLQGLYCGQGLLHQFQRPAIIGSQRLQGLIQPAVGVEALHQKGARLHHLRRQVQHLELGEHIIIEVVLLVLHGAVIAQPVVLLLGVLLMVIAVLGVGGLQPLQLAAKLIALVRPVVALLRLQHGVLLDRLFNILQQLLRPHLQDLHGLHHLGREGLYLLLCQVQFQGNFLPSPIFAVSRKKVYHGTGLNFNISPCRNITPRASAAAPPRSAGSGAAGIRPV